MRVEHEYNGQVDFYGPARRDTWWKPSSNQRQHGLDLLSGRRGSRRSAVVAWGKVHEPEVPLAAARGRVGARERDDHRRRGPQQDLTTSHWQPLGRTFRRGGSLVFFALLVHAKHHARSLRTSPAARMARHASPKLGVVQRHRAGVRVRLDGRHDCRGVAFTRNAVHEDEVLVQLPMRSSERPHTLGRPRRARCTASARAAPASAAWAPRAAAARR